MNIHKGEHEVLRAALDDWIGVWLVAAIVRRWHPEKSESELRISTVELLRGLIERGFLRAGDLPAGFEPWDLSADEIAAKIDAQWRSVGRIPNPPEGAWFELSERGRAEALSETEGF